MEAFSGIFSFMAGVPAMLGLVLASITIFVSSDWRLSLTALLVQYVLVGVALTRIVQPELAMVRILVGVLAVAILYLSARNVQEAKASEEDEKAEPRFLGLRLDWSAGPLGVPLRLLVVALVALAVIRFFEDYRALLPLLETGETVVPLDIAFIAFWLGGMGVVGLVLSGDPLRVAPALLTILAGFELIYASLESSPVVIGLWEGLVLVAALAFAYLITVQGLGERRKLRGAGTGLFSKGLSEPTVLDEEEPER